MRTSNVWWNTAIHLSSSVLKERESGVDWGGRQVDRQMPKDSRKKRVNPEMCDFIRLPLLSNSKLLVFVRRSRASPNVISCQNHPFLMFSLEAGEEHGTCQERTKTVNSASRVYLQFSSSNVIVILSFHLYLKP